MVSLLFQCPLFQVFVFILRMC